MTLLGVALILFGMLCSFALDDVDPYKAQFNWAWKLAHLIFMSGVVLLAGSFVAWMVRALT